MPDRPDGPRPAALVAVTLGVAAGVLVAVVAALAAFVVVDAPAVDAGSRAGAAGTATSSATHARAVEERTEDQVRPRRAFGADISWPECPHRMGIPGKKGQDKPMPPGDVRFVALGLTNGPAFTTNPCLARQVRWASRHHVPTAAYAVTTDPTARQLRRYGHAGPFGADTRSGRLANVGYQQAHFNLTTMEAAGLRSPSLWIDVEDSSLRVWPRTPRRNAHVVTGLLRAYDEAGLRVGAYSTPRYWDAILGRARLDLPEWRTAGPTSRSAAFAKCGSGASFQGGRALLAQWWDPQKDWDVLCPRRDGTPRLGRLGAWFHRP